MKSLRFFDRRAGYSLASLGLLLGVVAPAAIPALASAGTLTTRSIEMSSASTGATASYTVNFTGTTDIATSGGVIIQFCSESPLITDTCTSPTGMSTAGVGVGTVQYAGSNASSDGTVASLTGDHAVKWTAGADYTHATTLKIPLTGIVNPGDPAGTFYARITTYTDSTALATASTLPGTYDDEGAVALSTSDDVGVTAYVLESMTFCVANVAPTSNCSGISGHNPSMTLGETTGNVTALTPTAVSHGDDYAQMSTNAIGGAVVNLKSSTTGCGGLVRNYGTTNCDITAQNTDGASHDGTIAQGDAKFGVKLGTPVAATDDPDATGTLAPSGNYNTSRYYLDYTSGDTAGVTSPFGSTLFDTTGPVSDMNMPVTFGASISNTTPAGVYGATLNMVATGTF